MKTDNMNRIPGIRGMTSQLPNMAEVQRHIANLLINNAHSCGYREVNLPILEHTELFLRSIGAGTDIVGKEMYSFPDRHGNSLTLRPEGTASCVRTAIEHHLGQRKTERFWYTGPMFRYERPQKGRSRQFHQFGLEAIGFEHSSIETEMLLLTARMWSDLGLDLERHLELHISTLGNAESRSQYKQKLYDYLDAYRTELDFVSQERLDSNPLRIFDSKDASTQKIMEDAPVMMNYLDAESSAYFEHFQHDLAQTGLRFTLNPKLVRGLDYYNHTVFEWVAPAGLGAQSTICGGGRYDGLFTLLGGNPTPAAGCAVGLERLGLLLESLKLTPVVPGLRFLVALIPESPRGQLLQLAESVRSTDPNWTVTTYLGSASLKTQMKQAHSEQIDYVILAGPKELTQGHIKVRSMQSGQEQSFNLSSLSTLSDWVRSSQEAVQQ